MMITSRMREIITQESVLFSFYGALSQPFIDFFLSTISKQSAKSDNKSTIKALIIIAIEQVQNMMNYSQELSPTSPNECTALGMVVLGYDSTKECYYVNGSNQINPNDKEKITTKIEQINALDAQAQRKLLRQKLKSGEDAHLKGAGVGFVEMAKRSSSKLEYSFDEIDGKVYFNIMVFV